MIFNSIAFLLFLPVIFLLYWFIFYKSLLSQNILILLASYFFYGWWSWKFMGLLAISTFLDYLYGFSVASPNRKKAKVFLWLSVVNNLGILALFKYYNFFAVQIQNGLGLIGLNISPLLLNIALPIGISFYTFHGMSYVFDIYRGKQTPVKNFVEYAVFVSFFPLLVAGPIERANHLLPQVQKKRIFNYKQAVEGGRLILWGLIKKIVIADSLASIVDNTFHNYTNLNGITLITGAIAFSFQIYGDFSGYSDIALGTAKLFGFELLSNFKFPYFSRDIAEFWRRWHISLSSWFKDYLYIPLGGSKQGMYKSLRNTFIIFLVSGFWHGASWNYIIWGGIHAIGFMPLLLKSKNRNNISTVVAQNNLMPSFKEFGQLLITFSFVTFAWIFFRAHSLDQAWGYIKRIFITFIDSPYQFFSLSLWPNILIYIVPLLLIDWQFRKDERKLLVPNNKYLRRGVYILSILTISYFAIKNDNSTFIYFQF